MHKIHIGTSFETGDNKREHARIIAALEPATAIYEAAIKEITKLDVKIDIEPKLVRAPKDTAKEAPDAPGHRRHDAAGD